MHELQTWQIIVVTLFIIFAQYDGLNTAIGFAKPAIAGAVVGLLLGDLETGLKVGGTLNLLQLGLAAFGGATIPDYTVGTALGTAFAITSGQPIDQAVAVGVGLGIPIALFVTQFDILAKYTNTLVQHKADKYAEQGNIAGIERMNLLGLLPWALSRAIPVVLGLTLGSDKISELTNIYIIKHQILPGLQTAAGLLPALGVAILLRYLSIKGSVQYLILGFVLVAYLKLPVMAVSLIGAVFAIILFERRKEQGVAVVAGGGDDE